MHIRVSLYIHIDYLLYLFVLSKADISLAMFSTYHFLPQLSIMTARTLCNLQIYIQIRKLLCSRCLLYRSVLTIL